MPDLTTADIEQLLRASRDEVAYPPTPDIATHALNQIRAAVPDNRGSLGLITATPAHPARSQADTPTIPLDVDRPSVPGQLARLVAAVIAFVLVGGLVIAVFELTGGDDDDDQRAAPATVAAEQGRLYVLTNDDHVGRLVAYATDTVQDIYALEIAYASQATISPDGTRIYLMTPMTDTTPSSLIAVNAADGGVIWRAPQTMSPVGYISDGPPSMSLSADGSQLYLYVYRRNGDAFVGYSIRTIDAATGATIGEVETTDGPNSGCSPQLQASQSNGRIFLSCWTGDRVRIVDLGVGRFTYDIDLPARDSNGSDIQSSDSIAGTVQSPDGRYLYVVSDGPRVNVVNTGPGELEATHDIETREPAPVHRGLVALSDDGTRLAIGIRTVSHDDGLHDVGRIIVVDTATWQLVADLDLDPALHDPPMTGHAMTFSPDGSALYVAETVYEAGTVNVVESSSVVKIEIATGEREVAIETDDGDQVWRVFSGSTPADSSPDLGRQDIDRSSLLLLDLNPDAPEPDKLQLRPIDPTTLDDVDGVQPISVGQHWQHALSPDGRTLAAFTWPTQEPASGALQLLDLTTWQTTVAPVANIGSASHLSFTEDGESLYWIAGNYVTGEFVLWRYDLATEQASSVMTFPYQFNPWEHRMLSGNRLAVYGVPTDSGNLNAGDPRVIVVNLDDGVIMSDIVLDGIKGGQYREDIPRMYNPGRAWDIERELLYIVHSDEDVITLVDLERGGIVEITAYMPRQALTDRLLGWLVPSAAASPVPWTSRQAVLSSDGQTLFIAPGTSWNNWWQEDLDRFPLQMIDTANLSESREIDLPVINDMLLSPDGELLILQTFEYGVGADG